MINLPVDEAYAFDYLSILFIKKDISDHCFNMWTQCSDNIKKQIDDNLWHEIINSSEYLDLIAINKNVFDAVEKARYGTISAKEVDEKNMQRYYQKIRLQNKFFTNSKLAEAKT